MQLARRGPRGLALVLDDGSELPIQTAKGDVLVTAFRSNHDEWAGADEEWWSDCVLLEDAASLLLIVSAMDYQSYTGTRSSGDQAYRSTDGGRTWTEVAARWPEPRVLRAQLSTRD